MPRVGEPLARMGFLTIGLFDEDDPGAGHESTLQIIETGERLGFDSAWLRCRHLQHGISSPMTVLAAASQRTERIELGTAVIPLGLENPFRMAEDMATVDVLSHGRLNPGVSVGTPMRYEDFKTELYPDTWEHEDFSKERVSRLLRYLRGEAVTDFEGTVGIETFSRRIQPYSPGLADRLWYGGMKESAAWAGTQGINYLTSSVVTVEGSDLSGTQPEHFGLIQADHIDTYRQAYAAANPDKAPGRVSQGLVVIPTDSATAQQKERYAAYRAGRFDRTTSPQGPRRMLFAPDLVGDSATIAEQLHADPAFQRVDEVAFALPFTFEHEDYLQILTDMATHLGPALGWTAKQ